MDKKVYDTYVAQWDSWRKRTEEYYRKRVRIIKDESLSDEDQSKLLEVLDKNYDRQGFTSEYFGPWTEIRDREDLMNPKFILPGIGKNYSETIISKENIPENWGKIAQDCYSPENRGKIIGLGYDSGDYYLIIEKSNGQESTILMNSHYTIVES